MKAMMNDPKNPDYASMKEWLGLAKSEKFDPGFFRPERIRLMVPKVRRRFGGMSKEEIKYEINKVLDHSSDSALQELLEFLKEVEAKHNLDIEFRT